jgi:hypothetical protein
VQTTDAQVRKLMEEMKKHGRVGRAAVKADMDRKTARKYIREAKLPSELMQPRTWRTRENPFSHDDWTAIASRLEETPELEAKTLFEWLAERRPGVYTPGQLRTLQRHVRRWRAAHGPDKEILFAQRHRAGEAAQTDFTSTSELGVTIAGALFVHMLCVVMLPYSNWQWATVCLSESIMAMRRGVQAALFQLGRVPLFHQTDNSTAATHRIPKAQREQLPGKKRPFNAEYLALMRHFGMTPRTTAIGKKEQNGDVESTNGALKRRLEQALLLRGSRDFPAVEAWQDFVHGVLRKANATRGARLREELAAMRAVRTERLAEFVEIDLVVSSWSTVRVKHCAYSVPSRLIGETIHVRIYDARIEIYFVGVCELRCERLVGHGLHRIDYRHVIWSLMRKPAAFARYIYREELFPSLIFRRAYDAIQTPHHGTPGDLEYLRILHLAASTLEADVEAALARLFEDHLSITSDAVKAIVLRPAKVEAPSLTALDVDLASYDDLIAEVGT